MALSEKTKEILIVAMANKKAGEELAAAVDAGSNAQAESVAVLGTTTNLSAISASYADLAAARTSVNTLKGEVEARLDAIEAKVDAVITALKNAGIMA